MKPMGLGMSPVAEKFKELFPGTGNLLGEKLIQAAVDAGDFKLAADVRDALEQENNKKLMRKASGSGDKQCLLGANGSMHPW